MASYVPFALNTVVSGLFVRVSSGQVVLMLTLSNTEMEFDEHRLAVVFLDGEPLMDLCSAKSMADMMLDATGTVFFRYDKQEISGVIWHGDKREGLGVMAHVLAASRFQVRTYLSNYTSRDYDLHPDDFEQLKSGLRTEFLS